MSSKIRGSLQHFFQQNTTMSVNPSSAASTIPSSSDTMSRTLRLHCVDELERRVGNEVAVGEWFQIDQARVNLFAQATRDEQWIHVDPARAATGPYGMTIAHGHLTLAIMPTLLNDAITFENAKFAINYGFDRVRFPAPVPVGSRIRVRVTLQKLTRLPPRDGVEGAQIHWLVTAERDEGGKPACVANSISQRYWGPPKAAR